MAKRKASPTKAAPSRAKKPDPIAAQIKNANDEFAAFTASVIKNGLADALGLNDSLLGFNPGSIGTQLTQVDTLFKNNRWYLVSNFRQLLSECYVEHGLIQTIVDVPVDDAMRGGVEIKSKELDDEDIQKLQNWLEHEDILSSIVGQAGKWNRLFGGAGILMLTDQDPTSPLDIEAITESTPLDFRAVDMWELFYDKQNAEGYDVQLQEHDFEFFSYYGKKVHKSRVRRLKGKVAPSFVRPRLRGWGFSVVEALVTSINQYLKANNLVFEVLDEFKVDVYKIKNLTSTLLSPNGEQQVRRRVQLANQQKNFQNAITMDGEDDFIQKELSFTGIAETMVGIRMKCASDMRMPISKLFGTGASGFSSGEDDIENYNGMVESEVRAKTKPEVLWLLKLKCQQLFGMIPEDLEINFKPLRILSAEQEENVKNAQFTRLAQAQTAGQISLEEFRDGVNKANLLPIKLSDTELDSLEAGQEEASGDTDEGEGEGGANKEDSAKIAPKFKVKGPKSKLDAPQVKNTDFSDTDIILSDDSDDPELFQAKNSAIDTELEERLANPGTVDEPKWEKAKERVRKEYGSEKWPVVTYVYKKMGGTFK